jgi:hypothetical protein
MPPALLGWEGILPKHGKLGKINTLVGHYSSFVAENGALEIRERVGSILGEIKFEKPGMNGRKVSDYDSSS